MEGRTHRRSPEPALPREALEQRTHDAVDAHRPLTPGRARLLARVEVVAELLADAWVREGCHVVFAREVGLERARSIVMGLEGAEDVHDAWLIVLAGLLAATTPVYGSAPLPCGAAALVDRIVEELARVELDRERGNERDHTGHADTMRRAGGGVEWTAM